MSKLNLLGLLPGYYGGGAEKVMLSYFKHNNNLLISFKLFVSDSSGPLKGSIKKNVIEFNYKKFFYSIPALLKAINKHQINILFSTFPNVSVIIILLKLFKLHNCKIVIRQPNEINKSLTGSFKYSLIKFLYTNIIHKSDLLIVTSRFMEDEIISLNKQIRNIELIRNPINIKQIRRSVSPIKSNKKFIRLIFVGRLVYQKGIDRILHIIRNIERLELLVLGDGKELSNLKWIVRKYSIENKVRFLGYVKKPYNLVAGSDYFVLPSRWEGLPNSVSVNIIFYYFSATRYICGDNTSSNSCCFNKTQWQTFPFTKQYCYMSFLPYFPNISHIS